MLGRPYADKLRHVAFGVVLHEDRSCKRVGTWLRGASRNGAVALRWVLDEAVAAAREVVAEKSPLMSEEAREEVAQAVGIGAVVFNDLKNSRISNVKFELGKMVRFHGDTGPYLQFTHARLCSIQRKFAQEHPAPPPPDWALLTRDDEKNVLLIASLTPALERAVEADEPSIVALALLRLASAVSSWLSSPDPSAHVLCDNPALAATRLCVAQAAQISLHEGLRLLGVKAPMQM